jgi:hypothetical protein
MRTGAAAAVPERDIGGDDAKATDEVPNAPMLLINVITHPSMSRRRIRTSFRRVVSNDDNRSFPNRELWRGEEPGYRPVRRERPRE